MNVYFTVKSFGRKKSFLTKEALELSNVPSSLRELISELVTRSVKEYDARQVEAPIVAYLTNSEIQQQSSAGKVGFGTIYQDQKAPLEKAIATSIQAFADGLFRVFVNEIEVEQLDAPLDIKDQDEVAFIKLTMLTGRMW